MEINEEVILKNTIGYMKFTYQFYGLIKKVKNARNICFKFSEIVFLPIKIYSSLSNINICCSLK